MTAKFNMMNLTAGYQFKNVLQAGEEKIHKQKLHSSKWEIFSEVPYIQDVGLS